MSISEAGSALSNSVPTVPAPSAAEPLDMEILAQPCVVPPPPWLVFLSPAGQEDSLFRAIADALGSAFPIALVRPSFATYGRDLYATERLGADIRRAIRTALGEARFIVGGFCFGGLLSMEVVRQESGSGCVGLIMMDSPMPGHPHFLPTTRRKRQAYLRSLRAYVLGPHHYRPRELLFEAVRVPLYHLFLRTRPLLKPWMRFKCVRFTTDFSRRLPFQQVPKLRVPLLSILAARSSDDPRLEQYRLDWEIKADAGFEEYTVRGKHNQIFARSNVESIWRLIATWATSLPQSPRARRQATRNPDSERALEPQRTVMPTR